LAIEHRIVNSGFARLLLATEHTEFDQGAEALALALAHRCGLPLAIVLPLLSNPEYEEIAPQLAQRAENEAGAKLQALRQMAQAAGVTVQTRARRGPEPYREIVDEARERGSDLIVIRRRGKRGLLANLLVGEMVRNVVAHAPCSVLVTPQGASMWSRRVLAALDPQTSDLTPVSAAAAIAAQCELPLSLLCVTGAAVDAVYAAEQALQRAASATRAVGVAADSLQRSGRPHEQIIAAAQQTGADLLVIGRHGDDVVSRAWLGGVAQKVIGLAEMPVLVCVDGRSQSKGDS
jgi:nucleotide-binding universal stress UspA family protein